ncbi:DUF3093 family protein [Streptomyces microflavus]|uniref:DUF3093 family protein n=1 Tax=Streptomyces microflavus TaxID=1919 RepID=UPI0033F4D29E
MPPHPWWVIVFGFGLAMALVFLPYGAAAALVAFAAGGGLAASFTVSQGSMRIRVTPELLVVGDARLPLGTLGEPHALAGEEARAWHAVHHLARGAPGAEAPARLRLCHPILTRTLCARPATFCCHEDGGRTPRRPPRSMLRGGPAGAARCPGPCAGLRPRPRPRG